MPKRSSLSLLGREFKKLYHSRVPWFRHTSSWREVRRLALIRDNYTCQASGKKIPMKDAEGRGTGLAHVHHIEGAATNWRKRLELSNLVTLHGDFHKGKEYSFHNWMGGTQVPCTREDFFKWLRWLRRQGLINR